MGKAGARPGRTRHAASVAAGVLAAGCLLAAAVLGWTGWQRAVRDPLLARIDLSRPPTALPEADQYEVSGVVRPDLAVRWSEAGWGDKTGRLFLPLVGPDWTPGEPLRIVLRITLHGGAEAALYDARRQAVVTLNRPAPYATRPAAPLGGLVGLLSSPLPGAVAGRWASQGQPLAPDLAMLDETPGAASEECYAPAVVLGVLGVLLSVGATEARRKDRRHRRAKVA